MLVASIEHCQIRSKKRRKKFHLLISLPTFTPMCLQLYTSLFLYFWCVCFPKCYIIRVLSIYFKISSITEQSASRVSYAFTATFCQQIICHPYICLPHNILILEYFPICKLYAELPLDLGFLLLRENLVLF